MEKLLNTKEVSELLGVHDNTLYLWRRKGIGPRWFVLGKRKIMYPQTELKKYIKEEMKNEK